MIKLLSSISVSMLSLLYSNMADAVSCSSFDTNNEYHTEYHKIFSVCYDGYQQNNGHDEIHTAVNSDYHHSSYADDYERSGNANRHREKTSEHGGDRHHDVSGHYVKHDFDWSDYDLREHDHDEDDHFYGYKDHHGSKDHYDENYGHKHEYKCKNCPPYKGGETVVPVPAALWLFVSGLFGLLLTLRKK